MKVTKFIHSCLLVETETKNYLFDPGNYTYESKVLDLNKLPKLDYLLITHEHPDHMYIPLIKELQIKFPDLKIITNLSAKNILETENIKSEIQDDQLIQIETAPHEKVFGAQVPENILFEVDDLLTFPGDSFHFTSTTKILALPVQAPWGSLTQAVNLATSLKPEIILPIHDWHWREEARIALYKRLEDYFKSNGINFIPLQTGVSVEI